MIKSSLAMHWKVYCMEAVCLGIFMISASFFGTLLEAPHSPVHVSIPNAFTRMGLMGVAMGLTAIAIFYSPMGKLSGAHMNPAVTLTFLGLGKIKGVDAFYYILFQCLGGVLSVYLMVWLLGKPFQEAPVSYVMTVPGKQGALWAFGVEVLIAFITMMVVLTLTNRPKMAKYTGGLVGVLVCIYVIFTAPISGFSMNPARTLASAVPAMMFPTFWIYLLAPLLGMFIAAIVYKIGFGKVHCAKIFHSRHYPCIFHCGYRQPETLEAIMEMQEKQTVEKAIE